MRLLFVIGLAISSSLYAVAQDADPDLTNQIEALHAKWFKAFDSGDGFAMDRMETANLILVMPDGAIWPKTPRAGKQHKPVEPVEHTLSGVSVRRFGETTILTGILTTKHGNSLDKGATTVVFVKSSGNWKIASAQWTDMAK